MAASNGLLAIIGGEPKGAPTGEDDGDSAIKAAHRLKVDAMGDFLAAVQSKDAEGMANAFQAAYEACAGAKEEKAEGEEY